MRATKKDFEVFKVECQKWLDFFGIKDWDVFYHYRDLPDGVAARTWYDLNSRKAEISLSSVKDKWPRGCDDTVENHAKHEVLHLLLAPLSGKAVSRYVNEGEIDEAEHGIVSRLMKAL